MKIVALVLCLALSATAEETYESLGDFDVSEVLDNPRLLMSYAKCLLDKGPCTSDVKKLKDKLPEALETRCVKCTEKQKKMGKQLANELKTNRPELWKELVDKYDPKGKHQAAFKELLESK